MKTWYVLATEVKAGGLGTLEIAQSTSALSASAQQISGVWYLLIGSKMSAEEEEGKHSLLVLTYENAVVYLTCCIQP